MTNEPNTFATALNCMDGRAQIPVNQAVREIFQVQYVDTITEAGIVRYLADHPDSRETQAALASIRISLEKHNSHGIAIAAHADCAGNPISDSEQQQQLSRAHAALQSHFPDTSIVTFWLNHDMKVKVNTPEQIK